MDEEDEESVPEGANRPGEDKAEPEEVKEESAAEAAAREPKTEL